MKKLLSVFCIISLLCGLAICSEDSDLGPEANAVLKPLVRVKTSSATGSGTVIYSEDREDTGEFKTFILTNHHVVSDAIHVVKKWDSLSATWINVEENDRVTVEVFAYLRDGRTVMSQPIQAEVVAHKEDEDLALLKLDFPDRLTIVAPMLPADLALRLLQPVWAVGCSVGVDPIVTVGHINDLEELIEHKPYVMASADIIYGNSGGAVFTRSGEDFYFIGIPSRVRVTYSQALTHMGYFIPINRIRRFFKAQKLTFLLDKNVTPTESFEAREKVRRHGRKNVSGDDTGKQMGPPEPKRNKSNSGKTVKI
jgi:S1-C subfamily serine protease